MTQPTFIRRVVGRRPRLLDLFCCQGGAGKNYDDAGFDMTGVAKGPQPRYRAALAHLAPALEVAA